MLLLRERRSSRSSVNQASCSVRFPLCDVLGQSERRQGSRKCNRKTTRVLTLNLMGDGCASSQPHHENQVSQTFDKL